MKKMLLKDSRVFFTKSIEKMIYCNEIESTIEEDTGREIIETFQQALDLAGEFAVCVPAAA